MAGVLAICRLQAFCNQYVPLLKLRLSAPNVSGSGFKHFALRDQPSKHINSTKGEMIIMICLRSPATYT